VQQQPVIVIYGGMSAEREVSVCGGKYLLTILQSMNTVVGSVEISAEGFWLFSGGLFSGGLFSEGLFSEDSSTQSSPCPQTVESVKETKTAFCLADILCKYMHSVSGVSYLPQEICVFPLIHGAYGEDGCLQGLCELAGFSYVGSGVLGSALCMDKSMSKRLSMQVQIPTLPFVITKKSSWTKDSTTELEILKRSLADQGIAYPMIVKPCSQGSSYGVNIIEKKESMMEMIEYAFLYDDKVMFEPYLDDIVQLECAMLWDGKELLISDIGKVCHGGKIYSYAEKYHSENCYLERFSDDRNEGLVERLVERIKSYSKELFILFELSGMARLDWFYKPLEDKLYFNEINTIPGMVGESSHYFRLWSFSSLSPQEVIEKLVRGSDCR